MEVCPELGNIHQGSPGSLGSKDKYNKLYRHRSPRLLASPMHGSTIMVRYVC